MLQMMKETMLRRQAVLTVALLVAQEENKCKLIEKLEEVFYVKK